MMLPVQTSNLASNEANYPEKKGFNTVRGEMVHQSTCDRDHQRLRGWEPPGPGQRRVGSGHHTFQSDEVK